MLKTLKAFKKNKSPGLDGLTAEFYLEFWELVKEKLLQVYNEAYIKGVLPECLTTGVIVLLEMIPVALLGEQPMTGPN